MTDKRDTSPQQSDTPRSDAACTATLKEFRQLGPQNSIFVELARQLERELAEAQEANEELQVLVERFRKHSAQSASGGSDELREAAREALLDLKIVRAGGIANALPAIELLEKALQAPSGAGAAEADDAKRYRWILENGVPCSQGDECGCAIQELGADIDRELRRAAPAPTEEGKP